MFTLFDYYAKIGGLRGFLGLAFSTIVGLYSPILYSRSVLRHNFKYDSNTSVRLHDRMKTKPATNKIVNQKNIEINKNAVVLADRLRCQDNFVLPPSGLKCILDKLSAI